MKPWMIWIQLHFEKRLFLILKIFNLGGWRTMLEVVWERIIEFEGKAFKQIRGGEFYYKVNRNLI
jgi:hypothetical protein